MTTNTNALMLQNQLREAYAGLYTDLSARHISNYPAVSVHRYTNGARDAEPSRFGEGFLYLVNSTTNAPLLAYGSPGSGKVLTSDANGLASWVSAEVIPAGAVMFFNLSSCPSGWSELTAARGRYIVGLLSGGTLAGTVGNAFTTDLENRPVGQHNHTITDPGHSHVIPNDNAGGNSNTAVEGSLQGGTMSTDVNTTGISANNSGSVAGTNAPYIQLRVCQKS